MQTNFLLGKLAITDGAKAALKRLPYDLIARHAVNEHGLITAAERRQNELAMKTIGPIRSRYRVDPSQRSFGLVLVQTDATWSETLVSLDAF